MSFELEQQRELFLKALHNAIAWQNRSVELWEIIELFCMDAEAAVQPVQEPVADKSIVRALYTAPSKRPWVDLATKQIWKRSYESTEPEGFREGALWAQDKLKKQNI